MSFSSHFAQFSTWNLVLWAVLFVVVLTVELLGVFHGKPDTTLTYLIKTTVPLWLRCAILVWLTWHFTKP